MRNKIQHLIFPFFTQIRLYLHMNLQFCSSELVITYKTLQEVNTLRPSRKAVFFHSCTKSMQLPGFPAVAMQPILKDAKSHLCRMFYFANGKNEICKQLEGRKKKKEVYRYIHDHSYKSVYHTYSPNLLIYLSLLTLFFFHYCFLCQLQ